MINIYLPQQMGQLNSRAGNFNNIVEIKTL